MMKITKLFLLMMLFAFSSAFVFGQSNTEVKQSLEQSGLSKDKFAAQFDRVEDLTLTHANKSFVPTRDALLSEGFETWPPVGWTIDSPTGDDWIQDDGTDHGPGTAFAGDFAAMYNNYDISSGKNSSMTTPAFDVSALAYPTVTFFWWNEDGTYNPATLEVLTSTDGTTFTSLEVFEVLQSDGWVEYVHAIAADVTHVRVTAVSDYGMKNTFIDAFEIKELNLSPVLAVNYTGWNVGLAENNNMISEDSFVAFNDNLGDLEITSATLEGSSAFTTTFDVAAANAIFLTATPSYDFGFAFNPTTLGDHTATLTLVSNGGTQVLNLSGTSFAEGSTVESFETAVPPNAWEANVLNGTFNWAQKDLPAIGEYSAFFNCWSASSGYSAELISPQMDLTASVDNMLYFYYAHPTTTASYTDMLEVHVSVDNGTTWELLDEIMMQDLSWHLMSYDLSAYSGDEFKVKFVGISAYGQSIYVDHFVGPKLVSGDLVGYVYDEYADESMEGAEITLEGESTTSNSFGLYSLEQIPIGTYTVSCSYPGYITIVEELVILGDAPTELDFYMVREAEFSVDVTDLTVVVEPYETVAKTFTISNDAEVGGAVLNYDISLAFIERANSLVNYDLKGEAPSVANSEFGPTNGAAPIMNNNTSREAWDVVFNFNGETAAQAGIETDGENIYTAVWNGSDYYKYTMDGTFVESFTIAGTSAVRDMAYDGEYFYGSAASMTLFKMDLANQTLVESISVSCSGVTGIRHISYDPELDGGNGGFWIGNWSELGAVDMNGAELIANLGLGNSTYGSAYDGWTEGGPFLWLFNQPASDAVFYQFDIATQSLTGVTHDCSDAPGFNAGISGGAATYIADGKLIVLASLQQDPQLIVAYELAPVVTENWLTITDGGSGSIAPGESADVDVFFDAAGLVDLVKEANIVISHNGVIDSKSELGSIIPAEMTVTPFVHELAIFDIQFTTDPEGDSPWADSTVRTTGVITAGDGGSTYFLQDMEQTGSWNGIMIYTWDMEFAIGDKVTIVGEVVEYNGVTEIKNVITEMTTIISSGNMLPAPLLVTTGSFSEQFEGVLLAVENAECSNDDLGYGEWSVNDGTGDAMMDDVYYEFEPTLGNMYNVFGPLTYSYGAFKMLPRVASDIEDITNELPWSPLNLTADVQHRDVVLEWNQPFQYGWVGYYPAPQYVSKVAAERATYFDVTDFGFTYPIDITSLSHGFYELDPWGDDETFTFKIYDADGSTLIFESEELTALRQWENTVYELGETFTATGNFWVAVVPTNIESGFPASLGNAANTNGYIGEAGDWIPWLEWSTTAYMMGDGIGSKIAIEPSTPPVEISTTNLKDCVELDASELPFASRYLKSYNVYRNGSLLAEGVMAETYTDVALENGTYSYYVTSVWTAGESAASNTVSVQMFYGTLEGTVVDAEYDVAIPNAYILSTDGIYETTTDEDGYFVIDEVIFGTHDFVVAAEGYYADSFMGIEVVQNETTTVEFALDREFPAPLNVAVDPYQAIISWNSPFGLTYDDDFEDYTVGGFLAEQSGWTTWDGTAGGSTDALVSDEMAQSGTQSVKIHNYQETDLILEMGNRTSGVWEVNLSLYFSADGDGGYYNLLHDFDDGVSPEYAYEFTFDQLGAATFVAGGETINVTYNAGEWNTFKTVIDFESDLATLYINGTMAHSWQWSLTSQGEAGLNQLGAMDVFAASIGDANPFFYMDDVSYGVLQSKEVVNTNEAPTFLYYNVYLDDFKVLETNNSSYQYEGLDLNTMYVGSASAMYSYMGDLHESDIIDVEFTFLATDIVAPINLVATVSTFNDVELTWEYPAVTRRFMESVLIYRDGEVIDEIDGSATSYNEVVDAGVYEYYVQTKYTGFQMSDPSNTAEAEVILPAPRNLTGDGSGTVVALQWQAPQIIVGDEFTEGFEAGFPPADWTHVANNTIETWEQVGTVSFSTGDVVPHEGEKQLECYWDFGDQDEWMITPEFIADATTSLTFWTYVTNGSTEGDHYYLKVSADGGSTWDIKWDASAEAAGENHYDNAISIDLSEYEGENIKVAWQAYAIGGLWYAWFIDDVTVEMAEGVYSFNGKTLVQQPPVVSEITEQAQLSRDGKTVVTERNNRSFTAYNVYRNDVLVATTTDTYVIDNVYISDIYEYYVTADYDGYESEASNIVFIDVITGIDELDAASISLYPNPATSLINISSTNELTRIFVTNYVGQVVYQSELNNETSVKLNTSSYENGVYVVRLESENGVVTKRVIIAQ